MFKRLKRLFSSAVYNSHCIYCGLDLAEVPSNDEHVVGRKFVPTGALHQQWNVIAKSCVYQRVARSARTKPPQSWPTDERERVFANLWASILDRVGAKAEKLGDSTGRLKDLG